MWSISVLVLLCFSSTLAQRRVPDASSSDVLPAGDAAEKDSYKWNPDTMDDLWAEDGQDNYDYDGNSWETYDDEDASMKPEDSMDTVKDTYNPMPAQQEETGNSEQMFADDQTSSEATEEPVDIIDELNDWNDDSLTDDELYGKAGDSEDRDDDEEDYPADLSEYEDLQNWPDVDENDTYSDESESSEEAMTKLDPTPQLEEYRPRKVVKGREGGVFTVWHYAVFAISGAIFILGIVIIVGAAIRSARRPNSYYRRLTNPVRV